MAAGALRGPGCLASSSSSRRLRRYSPRTTQRQFAPRQLQRAPWACCRAASAAGSLGGSSQDGTEDAAAVSGWTGRPVHLSS